MRDEKGTQELTKGSHGALVRSIVSGQIPWSLASVSLIGWGLWCYLSTGLWDGHSKYQQQDAGCVDGFTEGVGHGGPDTRCDLMPDLSSSLGLVSPAPVSLPSGGVQCPRLPHIDKLVSPNACFLMVLARSAQHSQNNVLIVCIAFCCVPSLHQMTI